MTDAAIGYGATFSLHNGTSLVELEEVFSITPPNPQSAQVEATHYKSSGRTREYITGLIDLGEGTIEMNYVPGSPSDVLLRAAVAAGNARDYKIVIPDSPSNWQAIGKCIVTGYERSLPVDDRMTVTVTVRFTGAATESQVPA